MSHKVLSIVVPVVIVAVVVGVITFVVVSDKGGADAYSVNGVSVSQVTLNNELAGWADSKLPTATTGGPITTSTGAVTSEWTALWLTNRIGAAAIGNLLDKRGVAIKDSDKKDVASQLPKRFAKVPESAREIYLTIVVGSNELGTELGDSASAAIAREMRHLDVRVDPKYGRWVRARAEVCPWTGCPANTAQPSSGSGSAAG